MLNHEPNATCSGSVLRSPAPQPQTDAAILSPSYKDRLDDAVDQVCAPLIGTLPRADRMARQTALRQELDTLVAAHGELDAGPERAVSEALAHFARLHPVPILRGARSGVQESVTQSTAEAAPIASARPATLLALGLLVPVYLGHALKWTEALREPLRFDGPTQDRLELLAVPLAAGLLVGLLIRARATRGMFNACAALAVYTVGIPSLLGALSYLQLLPFDDNSFESRLAIDVAAGYVGLVLWPLLGCAGAFAGAAIRHRAGKSVTQRRRGTKKNKRT